MIEVTLSEEEQALCKDVPMSRYSTSRELGLTQLRIDTSEMNVELLGVQGELAFAKVFDLENPKDNLGSDGGTDYTIEEITIDVKAASKPTYRLVFRSLEAFKSQVGVLVVKINDNTFNIVGWTTRKQFAELSKPLNEGGFTLEQSQLRPVEELWKRLTIKRLKNA
jgi:hypothetical protein